MQWQYCGGRRGQGLRVAEARREKFMKKMALILVACAATTFTAFADGGLIYGHARLLTDVAREADLSIWAAGSPYSVFGCFQYEEYMVDGGRVNEGGGDDQPGRVTTLIDLNIVHVFQGDCWGPDFWSRASGWVGGIGYMNGRVVYAQVYVEDLWRTHPGNYVELLVFDAVHGNLLLARWAWSTDGKIHVLCFDG
jgi:hypothetical protein